MTVATRPDSKTEVIGRGTGVTYKMIMPLVWFELSHWENSIVQNIKCN